MSLHAPPSPEAQRQIRRQQRSSTFVSVLISLLIITLLALVLAVLILELPARNVESITIAHGRMPSPEPLVEKEVNILRKPNPTPGGRTNRVLVAHTIADLAVPVPDVLAEEVAPFGAGDGDDFGEGIEVAPPGGDDPVIDLRTSKRCSKADRLRRLEETGGPPEVEDGVVKTLRWLKANQGREGSWGSANKVGLTGLALLAYLGHCETPLSEEFGSSCMSAIIYLLDVAARNNGKMATNFQDKHWPYEHAIAAYALAEALSFSYLFNYNIPGHAEAVQNAGQWIIDNQHRSGGWDYSYDEAGPRGGDLSITGWHLQALKACQATRVEFRNLTTCVRQALDYVEACQDTSGGFGYAGTAPAGGLPVHSLTGVGVLSFQLWGKARHRAPRKGIAYLRAHAELDYSGPASDLYAHYYHSQALLQHGGAAWEKYNERLAPQLLGAQQADGSFARPGGGAPVDAVGALFAQDSPDGLVYRNCLGALMLEVYYRYLPGTGK